MKLFWGMRGPIVKERVKESADKKKLPRPVAVKLLFFKGKRRSKIPKGESKGAENDDYLATTWPPTEEFRDYLATPPKGKRRTNRIGGSSSGRTRLGPITTF